MWGLVIALLLLAGTGEAGETTVWKDITPGTVSKVCGSDGMCFSTYAEAAEYYHARQDYSQRMQEAMRKMDEHYYGTPVREWEKQTEQQRWLNKHWPQIMRECVK